MKTTQLTRVKKKNKRKESRELLLNISMFLLTNEKMKSLFWNVKTVEYKKSEHKVKIGINTTKKLGTTLNKLRSLRKDLSNYLYDQGLTIRRQTKIDFFVDKEDEIVARIYNLIDKVKENQAEFEPTQED
jgi:ribosome-binding factor A